MRQFSPNVSGKNVLCFAEFAKHGERRRCDDMLRRVPADDMLEVVYQPCEIRHPDECSPLLDVAHKISGPRGRLRPTML